MVKPYAASSAILLTTVLSGCSFFRPSGPPPEVPLMDVIAVAKCEIAKARDMMSDRTPDAEERAPFDALIPTLVRIDANVTIKDTAGGKVGLLNPIGGFNLSPSMSFAQTNTNSNKVSVEFKVKKDTGTKIDCDKYYEKYRWAGDLRFSEGQVYVSNQVINMIRGGPGFQADNAKIEMSFGVQRSTTDQAGIEIIVLNASASSTAERSDTHTLTIQSTFLNSKPVILGFKPGALSLDGLSDQFVIMRDDQGDRAGGEGGGGQEAPDRPGPSEPRPTPEPRPSPEPRNPATGETKSEAAESEYWDGVCSGTPERC